MLLRQMNYFVTVVKCNSFTEAAEQCYISQSAISQQIKALEDELGVELIHRENRKFTVTEAGEYFYKQSLIFLDQVERLKKETSSIGGNKGTSLTIGCLNTFGHGELQLTLADFAQKYPEVKINIVNGTHEELYNLLKDDKADMLFSDQRRVFSDAAENFPIVAPYRFIEVSSKSPLANLDKVTVEDLQGIPCILVSSKEEQNSERDYYQVYLGFGSQYIFAENLDVARLMAAANRGFVIMEGSLHMSPVGNAVKRIPLYKDGKHIIHRYYAYWMKAKTNQYIEAFAEMLRETFKKTVEEPSEE